jgi:hypothetical protein
MEKDGEGFRGFLVGFLNKFHLLGISFHRSGNSYLITILPIPLKNNKTSKNSINSTGLYTNVLFC